MMLGREHPARELLGRSMMTSSHLQGNVCNRTHDCIFCRVITEMTRPGDATFV